MKGLERKLEQYSMEDSMEFKITLSREERLLLLKGIWDRQYKIKTDIAELEQLGSDWVEDEIIKLKGKYEELYNLQIKLEG